MAGIIDLISIAARGDDVERHEWVFTPVAAEFILEINSFVLGHRAPSFRLVRISLRQRILEAGFERGMGVGIGLLEGLGDLIVDRFLEGFGLLVAEQFVFAEARLMGGNRSAERGAFG